SLHLDDDGEPAGTAGRPVAAVLERADFRRTAVVVTRWFGGTKLGTGGLGRAYGGVAAAVLERLSPAWAAPGRSMVVTFPYEDTGAVMRVVEASRGERSGEAWGEEATIRLMVPDADLDGLRRSLRDATAGRCRVSVGDETVLVPMPPVP
ncbi:MAG: YigZ family protein, partial [Gemmatimonadota bacterium]